MGREMGMNVIKAKREVSSQQPVLARAEIVDKATRGRFEVELEAALKRRPSHEAKLAGALRAIAPLSPALRTGMADAVALMLKRGTRDRELYAACIRSVAELDDRQAPALVRSAIAGEEAGGSAALSAACALRDPSLKAPLAKVAAARQSHLAFGAELARVVRGESNGAHLTALAPMIKESHRIAMCAELFIPLSRASASAAPLGPALTVLRGAERHLGRWLVLGEVAVKAGDDTPIVEARSRANVGPSSARSAWTLVLWALEQTAAEARRVSARDVPPPQTRPTLELVARLSDRPSADRDLTFLFRMADARATVARPMLETLIKQRPLADEISVRGALYLARDHGRDDLRAALEEAAVACKREELRGMAAGALWDVGMHHRAREIADDLVASKVIGNVAWGARIRAAAKIETSASDGNDGTRSALVAETPLRWVQWGWLE